MAPLVEKLPVPRVALGEGPHWDSRRQTLFYVDIPGKTFHRYVPTTKEHAQSKPLETQFTPNFFIPLVGHEDLFVAGIGRKVQVIRWDGGNTNVELVQEIAELDKDSPRNLINDGKVGPDGKLYTGTIGMNEPTSLSDQQNLTFNFNDTASFYSISDRGLVTKICSGVKSSNGIAFDQAKKALYHVDTFGDGVRRFDCDFATGSASNQKTLFAYEANNVPGYPDGMTIDTKGNIWVASFRGSNVLKISPSTGEVLQKIDIPALEVASVTFGGPNLDSLFVTTGALEDKTGGSSFVITGLGERGHENLPFNFKALN